MSENPSSSSYQEDKSVSSANVENESSTDESRSSTNVGVHEQQQVLASSETKQVNTIRVIVLLVLFAAAALVSVLIFFLTRDAEQEEFERAFEGNAKKVIFSFRDIVKEKFAAISSLGVSFTSFARAQSADSEGWPFVTMNDFQQRAKSSKQLSGALFLELLPIIHEKDRVRWENYSLSNADWINEGYKYQESLRAPSNQNDHEQDYNGTHRSLSSEQVDFSSGIGSKIYRFGGEFGVEPERGPGPFFPVWQSSPVLGRHLVNWNVFSYPPYVPGIQIATENGEMALGGIDVAAPGYSNDEDLTTSFFAIIQSFAAGKDVMYKGDPMSSVYVPVFDEYGDGGKPVACILSVFNWASYFEGILDPQSRGVIAVLDNGCNGPHSFFVNGTAVVYLGAGEKYAKRLGKMGVSAKLKDLLHEHESAPGSIELNQDQCPFTIEVFPSVELESSIKTSLPVIITIVIGSIFVFTALVFCVYDRLVERRQEIVLSTAQRSTAIVSSMFPETVRKRLMEDTNDGKTFQSKQSKLKSLLNNGMESTDDDMHKQPIADLFTSCSVLFADISGFTAWSSTREPAQVFILLQTIYQAFDKIAKRHKVFKVETIGDSVSLFRIL